MLRSVMDGRPIELAELGLVAVGPHDVSMGAIQGVGGLSVRANQSLVDGALVKWYRYWYHTFVVKITKTVDAMRNAPQNISYNDLRAVCVHFFGDLARAEHHTRCSRPRGQVIHG